MNISVQQKLTRLTETVPGIFSNKNIENALNDTRKAAETVCKAILLHALGDTKGQSLIDGKIDHKGNLLPKAKKLDLCGLIQQVARGEPHDSVVLPDYKVREKIKIYLESIRTHGNPASHDPDAASDVVTTGDCIYAKQALSQLLMWLYADYFNISVPDALRSCLLVDEEVKAINLPLSALRRFKAELHDWFKSLGYDFDLLNIENDSSFQFVVSFMERRRKTKVLVYGVISEIKVQHYNEVDGLYRHHDCDEGWIVTSSWVSKAVEDIVKSTKSGNVLCFNFDELIEQHIDLSKYFEWIKKEVSQKKIDERYISVGCERVELETGSKRFLAKEVYGLEEGFTEGYLDRWICDENKEHVSILGEFGTGKTWLTLHYAWKIVKKYDEARKKKLPRPRIPILVHLRDFSKSVSVDALISDFFFRKHEVEIKGVFSAFMQLNKMGKLLLIFDGFDEMSDKVNKQKMIDNFWELASVISGNSKVILTCRSEHFPQIKEGRSLLRAELVDSTRHLTGKSPQFEVLQLLKFSDEQIEEVLSFHTDREVIEHIMQNRNIVDLLRRPIMTDLILDALADIQKGKPLDMARVYLYATKRKMERDIEQTRTFTSLADKLFFMCELSWRMLSTDTLKIHYKDFYEIIDGLFRIGTESHEIDYWRYDMRAQTILIIDDEDGFYKPAHKSFLEFFVAFKFAAVLGMLPPDFVDVARTQSNMDASIPSRIARWRDYFTRDANEDGSLTLRAPLADFFAEDIDYLAETVGKEPFSRVILDLLVDIIRIADKGTQDKILAIIEACRCKKFDDVKYLPGNLILLLLSHRPDFFAGRDLSDLPLHKLMMPPHFDHDRGMYRDGFDMNFSNTKFERSDLTEAIFSNGRLDERAEVRGVDFSCANLRKFGFRFPQMDCLAISPDSSLLAAGGPDEVSVIRSDTLDPVVIIKTSAWSVKFSPCGQFLVCSGWGEVKLICLRDLEDSRVFRLSEQSNASASEPDNRWTTGVAFSRDSSILMVGCVDSYIYLFNFESGEEIGVLECLYGNEEVSLSPSGKYLASSGFDELILWNLEDGTKKHVETQDTDELIWHKGVFHPQDETLCFLKKDTIRFIDALTLNITEELESSNADWEDFAFSGNGEIFAACTRSSVKICEYIGGKILPVFEIHSSDAKQFCAPTTDMGDVSFDYGTTLVMDYDGKFLFAIVEMAILKIDITQRRVVDSYMRVWGVGDAKFDGAKGVDGCLMQNLLRNSRTHALEFPDNFPADEGV